MFVLILIVAAGVVGYVALTPRVQSLRNPGVGSPAPNFSLSDTNSGTFALSEYQGRSYVLLFFNEGLMCSPCLRQMSDLDALNQQFLDLNIVVASITTDPLNQLTDWDQASGPANSRVLSDQSLAVSKAYNVLGPDTSMMPGTRAGHTFFLLDQSGMIVWRKDYGPSTMYVPNDQLIAGVRQALGV
ncbi:MAG: peroxiredoxin family protein [Nitrososphaera sp.]